MRHSNGTSCLGERCAQSQGADHSTPRHRPLPRSSVGLLRGEGGGRATHAAQRAPTPLPEGQSPPAPATKAASASAPQPPAEPYFGPPPATPADGLPGHAVRGSAGGEAATPPPHATPKHAPGGRTGETAPEAAGEPGSSAAGGRAARRGHVPPHAAPAPQASPPRPSRAPRSRL